MQSLGGRVRAARAAGAPRRRAVRRGRGAREGRGGGAAGGLGGGGAAERFDEATERTTAGARGCGRRGA